MLAKMIQTQHDPCAAQSFWSLSQCGGTPVTPSRLQCALLGYILPLAKKLFPVFACSKWADLCFYVWYGQ